MGGSESYAVAEIIDRKSRHYRIQIHHRKWLTALPVKEHIVQFRIVMGHTQW